MKYRVVACSCIDANILADAQCTNISLMRLESEVLSSIHPHAEQAVVKPHWTHLLIDEVRIHREFTATRAHDRVIVNPQAAQGSEPELCIPISVIATDTPSPLSSGPVGGKTELSQPQLILCGDRFQRTA